MERSQFKNDPANFVKLKNLTPEINNLILNLGPCQPFQNDLPENKFPRDKYNCSFKETYYLRILPDNSKIKRDWLSYSPSEDKIYCVHCFLFGTNLHNSTQKTWTKNGFNTWKNITHAIKAHENTPDHITCSIKLKLKKASAPILPELHQTRNIQISMNRQIVSELIDIVLFLAHHNLAFRGHQEKWSSNSSMGNFKDLIVLMAKNSTLLSDHISKVKNQGRHVTSFISWQRQNQIIEAIYTNIFKQICQDLSNSCMFSISIDTTFDISRKEQVSFVARYSNEITGSVHERVIAVNESPSTTGEDLYNLFVTVMEKGSVDWKTNLVGQSYDGASNMSGNYKGLQSRIRDLNPQAVFIWCHAHRFNLVVKDAVSSSCNAVDMFGNLESLYAFLWCSKKRAAIFRENQLKTNSEKNQKNQIHAIQRITTTRWGSHSAALNVVLKFHDAVIITLKTIRSSEGPSDARAGATASGLINYFSSCRFLLVAMLFQKVFFILAPINKQLQAHDSDILIASQLIKNAKLDTENLRSKGVTEIKRAADDFAKDSSIEFENINAPRKKRVPRNAGEKCIDEALDEPLDNFKVNTYYVVCDTIISELCQRFGDSDGLLKDISLLSSKRLKEVGKNLNLIPNDAFVEVCSVYKNYLDRTLLIEEYQQFVRNYEEIENTRQLPKTFRSLNLCNEYNDDEFSQVDLNLEDEFEDTDNISQDVSNKPKNMATVLELFQLFCSANLNAVFPTLYMLLKICVTLPVSSCSVERSFSKLKLLKTKLRSTMIESRLEHLMIINCERDIPVDKENVIQTLCTLSSSLSKSLVY